jgi:hypothetical protein
MRFFDLRTDRSRCKQSKRSTSRALGCHSRVLPQRLVDDSLIEKSLGRICGAKPPDGSNRSAAFPVPESTPEGVRTESSSSDGQARTIAKPEARDSDVSAAPNVGRSFGSTRCDVTNDEANTNTVVTSFTWTRAEARERVLPRRVGSDRSHTRSAEATLSETRGKP